MSTQQWYEVVGHTASILILVSLLMQSLWRLRVINLVGAIFFTGYGILIDSTPIYLVNVAIVFIDIWWLWTMSREEEYFSLLEADRKGSYLAKFLEFHAKDISTFQPDFSLPDTDSPAYFILRNMLPVGLWIGHEITEDTIEIDLDYVIPRYRDTKAGAFFYGATPVPAKTFITPPPTDGHRRYLERMGFTSRADGWYVRSIQ